MKSQPFEVLNNICEHLEKNHKQMYGREIGNIVFEDSDTRINDHNEIFKKDAEGKWYYYASAFKLGQHS